MHEQIESLAARLTVLEDREAIRDLKARYCTICDDGHNPELITSVFTEDGVWESELHGRIEGHAAIRDQFTIFAESVYFTHHIVTNPVIIVDGDVARGTWYFMSPVQLSDEARWNFVQYDETYVRVGREWRIGHMKVTLRASSLRAGSWIDVPTDGIRAAADRGAK